MRKQHPVDLQDSLKRFLEKQIEGTNAAPLLLIAVSGGADSMSLLDLSVKLSRSGSFGIVAAHLIHHPDSPEAHERAKLVEEFCRANQIQFFSEVLVDTNSPNRSPEERMRQERYRFLTNTASQYSCDYILTAHHADDQAETILERIITGTGLRGLAGIPERRDNVLRPFLSLRKYQLIDYCEVNEIPYADDPANFELNSPRNRIRRVLIPDLEKSFNPDVQAALCRLGCWAAEANQIIESQVEQAYQKSRLNFQKGKIVLDIRSILTYFTLIQKYVLRRAISEVAGSEVRLKSTDFERMVTFLQNSRSGAYLFFAGGVRVARHRDTLIISQRKLTDYSITIFPGQDQIIPGLSLRTIWKEVNAGSYNAGCGNQADLQITDPPGPLILRHARVGDRFHPLGAPGEKRLFRFLNDRNVSRFDKHTTLVLQKNDKIIWVVGHRISEKARVIPGTDGNWSLSLVPHDLDSAE
ncbi:MAG: tRNA lysidine(34) synthetase TilS [bacterium]|nr:tRNA lysidine(34) synthetase TilS [bacterium]